MRIHGVIQITFHFKSVIVFNSLRQIGKKCSNMFDHTLSYILYAGLTHSEFKYLLILSQLRERKVEYIFSTYFKSLDATFTGTVILMQINKK